MMNSTQQNEVNGGTPLAEPIGSDMCPICGSDLKWGITRKGRRIGRCGQHGYVRLFENPLRRENVGVIRRFLKWIF